MGTLFDYIELRVKSSAFRTRCAARREFRFRLAMFRVPTRQLTLPSNLMPPLDGIARLHQDCRRPEPPAKGSSVRRQLPDVRLLMKQYIWIPKRFCQSTPIPIKRMNWFVLQSSSPGSVFPCHHSWELCQCACLALVLLLCAKSLLKPSIITLDHFLRLKVWLEGLLVFCRLGAAEPDIVLPVVVGFVGSRILHVLEWEHASPQICRSCMFILKERWTCLH